MTSPDGAGPEPEPTPTPTPRPGSGTFTIEGRAAPALFVIGWLATLLGLGIVVIGAMSGDRSGAIVLLLAGLVLLSIGLVAGAGAQGIERRARGGLAYQGPSPLLVFIAAIPVSLVAVIILSLPLVALGVDVDGPFGRFLSVGVQTLVYVGLIRLLVVDAGALSWSDMGIRRPDGRAIGELISGAGWAIPVIVVTIPISAILLALFPVTPVSPLPPTGETTGFILQFVAGAIFAPIGEEVLFRGLATTAWVAVAWHAARRDPSGVGVRCRPRPDRDRQHDAGGLRVGRRGVRDEGAGRARPGLAVRPPRLASGYRSDCTWPSTASCSSLGEAALRSVQAVSGGEAAVESAVSAHR